jgi:hypothetical protein
MLFMISRSLWNNGSKGARALSLIPTIPESKEITLGSIQYIAKHNELLQPIVFNFIEYLTSTPCKRLDLCWPQWVHFGSQKHHRTSWNSMEPHRILRNLMESHGSSWNLTEAHGIPRKLMESYRSSWNPTEPHGILRKVLEHGGIFWLLTNDYK